MKKSKTALLFTSIFAAAVNMNGCGVYGPPEFDPSQNIAQPEYGAPYYMEPTMAVTTTEMDWLRENRYAVFRVVSVPEVLPEEEEIPEYVICGVELLSCYAGNDENLSKLSRISFRGEDLHLFDEGNVIFAELGEGVPEDETFCYEVKYDVYGPVMNRFIDRKLVVWEEFRNHESYKCFLDFNGYTEWNYLVNQTGIVNESTGEPVYFTDGMTVEDTALFFAALEKAHKENENPSENE